MVDKKAQLFANLLVHNSQKLGYGINGKDTPKVLSYNDPLPGKVDVNEVMGALPSGWKHRQQNPSQFSEEMRTSLADTPDLMNKHLFYPPQQRLKRLFNV